MTRAYASARLEADVDRVWDVVGDFHGVGAWVSGLQTCVAKGGNGRGDVGSIREFTVSRRTDPLQETLVGYDAAARRYSYEFVGTIPYPVSSYRGTVHLLPITVDTTTFIEWSGEFEAACDVREKVRVDFEKLYRSFFADLRKHLATVSPVSP